MFQAIATTGTIPVARPSENSPAEIMRLLDAILATPGLDGIYVGPNDLAIEMGYGPANEHDEPAVIAAIESAREA